MTRAHSLAGCRTSALAAWGYAAFAIALLLWPYRFSWPVERTPNGVGWLAGGGVAFHAPGVIHSGGDTGAVIRALAAGQGFGIEAWVASASLDQVGPARIVGSSLDVDHRNFMLGQEHAKLAVRLRTDRTNANGTPGLRVADVFVPGALRHLVVSYDGATLRVFVDGRLRGETREPGGSIALWDPEYPIRLGNENNGTRHWLGSVFRLALYARALDAADAARAFAAGWSAPLQERDTQALVALYRFDSGRGTQVADASGHAASLVIPGELRIGERRLLAWRDRGRGLDRLVNTVAFVPFGFAIERTLAGRRRARARLAIGLCITFSLAVGVEIAQYFLAARTSSWIDAILNALGAGIGIGIARGVRAPCLQLRV